jgi:hypothetical protein
MNSVFDQDFENWKNFVIGQISQIRNDLSHQVFQIPSILSSLHLTCLQILTIARLLRL